MGTVFTVKLVEDSSGKVIGIYACKIILKSYLMAQNTERRNLDLQREISLLKEADAETSV